MKILPIPHFVIKNRFQKGGLYENLLTRSILSDVCQKLTGQKNYTVKYLDEVNVGRQAKLYFNNCIIYISFSEDKVASRNSSFQSFPTALVNYLNEENPNKRICYYILETKANIETPYFLFMYRLMKTVDTEFINEDEMLTKRITSFATIEDIILSKNHLRKRNSGNNSSYITKDAEEVVQVFGKLYGANKYETALLCIALYKVTTENIVLYEIEEKKLTKLPRLSREYLISLDRFKIITATVTLEETEFKDNDSLRSPRYLYNLLEKYGSKKCALCDCEIPEIIQGAHIWAVAEIKKQAHLSQQEKLDHAINGDNGLWLCNNHHKLLDANIIGFFNDNSIKLKSSLSAKQLVYLTRLTTIKKLNFELTSTKFNHYLSLRNQTIIETEYIEFPH